MNIIETRDITKIYRQGQIEVPALKGVSLDIAEGSFAALAGPSGSGKTTLLNIIGGLDRPSGGGVMVDGIDLSRCNQGDLAAMRMNKIGFVFQAYNLVPVLSAEENVEFIMMLQGVPSKERRTRARTVLAEVGLGDMTKRRPAELSGGQQQRVAVARALAAGPKLVLADEPTANLDSRTGEALLDTMHEMNEQHGVTFIFSTHDRMVMEHADRLIFLHDGLVVPEVEATAE
ncbi:MAG: ABC transporter ATP-binding protein [Pseudomonadota bacterium]|nr:ABC transporter ATP-binding protein [Pseudomonadota bacterium]